MPDQSGKINNAGRDRHWLLRLVLWIFGWEKERWTGSNGLTYETRRHKITREVQARHIGIMGDGDWHHPEDSQSWENEEILKHYSENPQLCNEGEADNT